MASLSYMQDNLPLESLKGAWEREREQKGTGIYSKRYIWTSIAIYHSLFLGNHTAF